MNEIPKQPSLEDLQNWLRDKLEQLADGLNESITGGKLAQDGSEYTPNESDKDLLVRIRGVLESTFLQTPVDQLEGLTSMQLAEQVLLPLPRQEQAIANIIEQLHQTQGIQLQAAPSMEEAYYNNLIDLLTQRLGKSREAIVQIVTPERCEAGLSLQDIQQIEKELKNQ